MEYENILLCNFNNNVQMLLQL